GPAHGATRERAETRDVDGARGREGARGCGPCRQRPHQDHRRYEQPRPAHLDLLGIVRRGHAPRRSYTLQDCEFKRSTKDGKTPRGCALSYSACTSQPRYISDSTASVTNAVAWCASANVYGPGRTAAAERAFVG